MIKVSEGRLAKAVEYLASSRAIKITLDNGDEYLVMVDVLQMENWNGDCIVAAPTATDAQLSDVKVWGGGASIRFPQIDQTFDVDMITSGIYGTERWMKALAEKMRLVIAA